MFQGKLASEQHIRELCGSMIDGERSLFGHQLRFTVVINKCNSVFCFLYSVVQIRSHSWLQTFEGPWHLEWWAAPGLQALQDSQELEVLLGIQALEDHQGTGASQESLEILVPEV